MISLMVFYLNRFGAPLDYEYIQETRPEIIEILR